MWISVWCNLSSMTSSIFYVSDMHNKAEGSKKKQVEKAEQSRQFVLPVPGNPWTVVGVWHAPSVWACTPDELAYRAWSKTPWPQTPRERDGEESQSQRGRKHDRERQKGETKMQRGSERTKIIQISYRKSFSLSYFHLNIQWLICFILIHLQCKAKTEEKMCFTLSYRPHF